MQEAFFTVALVLMIGFAGWKITYLITAAVMDSLFHDRGICALFVLNTLSLGAIPAILASINTGFLFNYYVAAVSVSTLGVAAYIFFAFKIIGRR
ncbi:hypothetical protein HBO04_20760 [Pseudomonas proteolytica]|uniref:hypothetical protein n=1 Tax=Pseudomonas proteolytica TaxID=219574 RepID=UPI001473C6CF|nr:hypothetical protein [Pseudomonas proteolytica]NMZ02556.1 hypothetical protein [Pseudomonas proteolytica]